MGPDDVFCDDVLSDKVFIDDVRHGQTRRRGEISALTLIVITIGPDDVFCDDVSVTKVFVIVREKTRGNLCSIL